MHETQCPVCNGLREIVQPCSKCKNTLIDLGRYTDCFGDYSPYRPIDDLKKTDGLIDFTTHQCPHHLSCNKCSYSTVILIQET